MENKTSQYAVGVRRLVERDVVVEAKSKGEAELMVRAMIEAGDVAIDVDDISDASGNIVIDDPDSMSGASTVNVPAFAPTEKMSPAAESKFAEIIGGALDRLLNSCTGESSRNGKVLPCDFYHWKKGDDIAAIRSELDAFKAGK